MLASFDSELIMVRMHLLLSTVMKKESSMNSLLPLNKKGKKRVFLELVNAKIAQHFWAEAICMLYC